MHILKYIIIIHSQPNHPYQPIHLTTSGIDSMYIDSTSSATNYTFIYINKLYFYLLFFLLLLFLIVNLFAWPTTIKKKYIAEKIKKSYSKTLQPVQQTRPQFYVWTCNLISIFMDMRYTIWHTIRYVLLKYMPVRPFVRLSIHLYNCLYVCLSAWLYDGDAFACNIDKLFVIVLHVQNMFSSIFYNYFLIKKLYWKKKQIHRIMYTLILSQRGCSFPT